MTTINCNYSNSISNFIFIFSLVLLQLISVRMTFAFEPSCEDYPWTLNDEGVQCLWIRNDSPDIIYVTDFYPYNDNDPDLNDDYFIQIPKTINPGETIPFASIDDRGFGSDDLNDLIKFRAEVRIGNIQAPATYAAYLSAKIHWLFGTVDDFEFGVNAADSWHDDDTNSITNYTLLDGITIPYRTYYTDSENWEAVYSFRRNADINKMSMGFELPDTSNDGTKINVMNWNTYLLIGPTGVTSGKPDYCARAKMIYDERNRIFKNVDILVLEELASQDYCTPDAEELATGEYLCCGPDKPFRDRTSLLNGEPLVNGVAGPENTGGVVIMSKYPNSLTRGNKKDIDSSDTITQSGKNYEIHYLFTSLSGECSGFDCSMDKGFLKIKFTKGNMDYYIIGTHSQADPGADDKAARRKQWQAIKKHIDTLPTDAAILIVGDLNTEQVEISIMKNDLYAAEYGKDTTVGRGLLFTEHYRTNSYVSGQIRKEYDWILYSKHGLKPSNMTWRILPVRGNFKHFLAGDLSDHHAVIAELDFVEDTGLQGYWSLAKSANNPTGLLGLAIGGGDAVKYNSPYLVNNSQTGVTAGS